MQTRFALPFAILIAVSTAACSTEWAASPLPPGPQPAPIAGRVRVTRSSGERLYLASAEVRGDSLYGTRTYSVEDPRIALPLTDVARIEEARASSTVPALLTLVTAALVFRWMVLPQMYD